MGLTELWRQITRGLHTLLHREASDRDIADEVRHYMAEAEAELVAEGASPEEARRAVRLRYGDALTSREDVRSYGWENLLASVATDVRYGLRRLRRSPGFTVVAVLTLGLGIGAATAIFSAVYPVLFEPLPYPHADRLVALASRASDGSPVPVTFGTYRELLERSRSFQSLAVFKAWQPTVTGVTGAGRPERLQGQRVSSGYFQVLGVSPEVGPGFDAADDRVGGPDVVILSDALWRRRFGADSAIVGRQVRLDDRPFTVVGVMPRSFENVPGHPSEVWALLQYDASLPGFGGREWGHHLDMVGRLRPGLTPADARAGLARIAAHPVPELARPAWATMGDGLSVRSLETAATAGVRPVLLALLGAAVLLLGIACVNVMNLVLARGARRRGEMAMRAALGAARVRLVRQLVTESLLLAALGGVLGVGVAAAGVRVLLELSPQGLPRLDAVRLDGVALAFALGVTTLLGLLVGLAPMLRGSRSGLSGGVRDAGRRTAGRHATTRGALVVTEVALALVLLVGAGLLVRSMQRLFAVAPGFDPSGVVAMQVQIAGPRYAENAATHRFFAQALDAARRVPGVASAALTSQLPLSGDRADAYGITYHDDSRPSDTDHSGYRYVVSPGYFRVMGIHLIRGRVLDEQDDSAAPRVVVVNQAFARSAFPGQNPLGRRVHAGSVDQPAYTIVGVVDDVKQASLGEDEAFGFYVTPGQWYFADHALWLVARADGGDGSALIPALERAVWSVDPGQAIVRTSTMQSMVSRSEAQRGFAMVVLEAFALLALVLAGVGLYGVLAGSVTERTREIGVRVALGASRERIVGLVVRQGLALTGVGAIIGLVGAAVATEAVASLLFGVSRLDPLTYAGVVAVLAAVAVIACWVPAARAARVDPVRTLRAE